MPALSRTGQDTAGGTIVGIMAPTVFVNGSPIACKGALVAPHGPPPHDAPVMVGASTSVFANSIRVCRQGDAASCGHAATGSDNVNAG